MSHLLCSVYRSSKREECYLYIDKKQGLDCIPEELLNLFGTPKEVMTLILTAEKKLARVDINKVIQAVREQGYFLQLPPPIDTEMQKIHLQNDKFPQA